MSDNCVINPLTNRPIKKGGAIYNKLLKKGLLDNAEKDCIVNEKTGRAVRASGKVGKEVIKRDAGTKIAGAIKRKLAKKPEPPKPETPKPIKKFGFEDLPSDVKDIISGVVKQQKSRYSMNKQIKDFLYYTGLKNPYNKLTDEELYDVLYRSNDLKKYVETNYIKNVINKMPDMGGKPLKNKIKYEYLQKFIKDNNFSGVGEGVRFVEHYRNNSNNRWLNVILNEASIGGNTTSYVFLDMDKNMFWRIKLIDDRNIKERLEDDGIVSRRGLRRWNELVNDAGDGLVKEDLVNGRLVYDWNKHIVKENEKK